MGHYCICFTSLIDTRAAVALVGEIPAVFVFCYELWKIIRFLLGQDILSFCLELQTLCVCLDS